LESVHLMGRKERREREQKRENYATQHSKAKRKETLIAIGVISLIAVIVGYSAWVFINMDQSSAPGGPEGAGALGSEHAHAGILVKIFGDTFGFDGPSFQIKTPWIHFEGRDGSTMHKHATGVTLEYLFNSLNIGLDDQCYVFPDGKSFCTQDDYTLNFFINGEQVSDIRDHEGMEGDKILIVYGDETLEQIDTYLLQLEFQKLLK